MSKANPLSGLLANYGDSDDSDDEMVHASYGVPGKKINTSVPPVGQDPTPNFAGIHPAPIQHCPWSACYDESSGFTYYWNQQTNAVTWEAPPEYLLALKIAQQQLHCAGSAEVSAEEWQLYQQVLAEKQNTQNKMIAKAAINSLNKSSIIENPSLPVIDNKKPKTGKKRPTSDDEEEKIELITSYHNSDSESNDEAESPIKVQRIVPIIQQKPAVKVQKKQKIKPQVEYGPSMPPNLNYTVPIGPELPPNLEITPEPKPPERKVEIVAIEKEPEKKSPVSIDNEDSQDEISLLKKLKDKAKLLEKLGGELPSELQQIIKDETNLSSTASLSSVDNKNIDIDDMLEEIEKTEFLKTKPKETKSSKSSVHNSPRSDGHRTPPLEELKTLFPSTKNHTDEPIPLFPSVANFEETSNSKPPSPEQKPAPEKKENMYLMDVNEPIENVGRKKLRISNSVLPERKIEKSEPPAYTTKYSQYIEGFSDQRTGLGFKEEDKCDSPKNTINYGNGLTFTKGETLNEGKQEEDLQDLTDLIGAKLRYLNELQPCVVTPVQEMLIQLQTLVSGWECGGVCAGYVRRWAGGAGAALAHHEAEAAPPGWTCTFQRSEGRYRYRREADGLQQWEYPALDNTDMDISTTPPHTAALDTKVSNLTTTSQQRTRK
ncbi:Formin-binding protein 4 [Papilio xuthus]|uniref:Formin-binding protein 4 n=1 Tax=Papilio xuthus TaxID=66420 RepID=A0A194PSJ7_PAPXU|nr:Formin-binding protein 4 [Papilio xuthus]